MDPSPRSKENHIVPVPGAGETESRRLTQRERTLAAAMARVRTDNTSIAALIAAATEQSATFKDLIDTINASDGIVYVEAGTCGHGVRACLVHSVTVAGLNRILRITVDTHMKDHDVMWYTGHELQHAVEVLSDRTVRSDVAMYFFYEQQGTMFARRFETAATIDAGDAVRDEVRHSRARAEAR